MSEVREDTVGDYQPVAHVELSNAPPPLDDLVRQLRKFFLTLRSPTRIHKDLNADLLDGYHASDFVRQSGGGGTALATNDNIPAGTVVDLQWPAQDGTAAAFASYPPTDNMPVRTDGNLVIPEAIDLAAAANNVTGILTVPNGGTGRSSLTADGFIRGAGTSAVAVTGPGTDQLIGYNGTTPALISAGSGVTISGGTISASGSGGTVTDVTATAPIASSGGATPNITHDDTAVTPGAYTYASVTVDQKGHVTAASSGAAPVTSVGATAPIASSGGTTPTISHNDTAVTPGSYTNVSATVDQKGHITAMSSGTAPVTSVGATAPIASSGGTTPTISHNTSGVAAGDYINPNITVDDKGHITAASSGGTGDYGSTGIITGGVLSIGTGGAGVATTFTIASGTGKVVDPTTNPPTVTAVSWSAKTDVAVTNIGTQLVTFVAIDSAGNVQQSGTLWTPAQNRDYIAIGVVVHSNLTTVNAVNQGQGPLQSLGNQFVDLSLSLGTFNIAGNVFSANGANLKLNKSAGSVFRQGANYTTLTDNPHVVTLASLTQASLRMQNQTGAGSASTTDIDPDNYDVGGVTTAVPANKFTVLRIFSFVSNLVAVQRGQAVYNSLAEAKAAIQTEPYVTNDILTANGILRGFLVVRRGTTSLSNASDAFFIESGRFGGSAGVGGLSVSTLQNAYDNSSNPEITTSTTLGAVTVKRGSAADTDTVIEGQNGAGSTTFSVTGAGNVTANSIATLSTALSVANGGTGATTLTDEALLVGNGTGAVQTLAVGTGNYVVKVNSGATAFEVGEPLMLTNTVSTTTYTPTSGGYHVLDTDAAGSSIAVTMPASVKAGQVHIFQRDGANNATITANTGQNINGVSEGTITLSADFAAVMVVGIGSHWYATQYTVPTVA